MVVMCYYLVTDVTYCFIMNFKVLSVLLCLLTVSELQEYSNIPDTCESDIYCRGKLLNDVQMSRIFTDSKTFVDKKLIYPVNDVLDKYENLANQYESKIPPPEILRKFVDENFEDGNELELWEPSDWLENPPVLNRIKDQNLKDWAFQLNAIWKNLSRRITDEVKRNPEVYSLIYVPNGFIIPGGRFRELYYWDTFWIVNGLLICQMSETARGVIENLLYLLKSLGHIPNGNRVYYIQRTQPSLITQMVESYYSYTQDLAFVKKYIHLLDKEMDYWQTTRIVKVRKDGRSYKLFRYFAVSEGPRPESYREDVLTSEHVIQDQKRALFIDIKSAAESGWDFSSRWFIDNATNNGNMSKIHTQYIIPVDLNALMHKNAIILTKWYKMLGEKQKMKKYELIAKNILQGIDAVLWNKKEEIWLDYDNFNGISRNYFYLSNLAPFWTQSHIFSPNQAAKIATKYINKVKLDQFVGGSPTSLQLSGEQWDYPNAWPPLQAFFIQGLDRIGTKQTSDLAFQYALKYVQANYKGFHDFEAMFEKYNALLMGRTGNGGEYDAQKGFGWTNGLAFELLNRWGMKLTSI